MNRRGFFAGLLGCLGTLVGVKAASKITVHVGGIQTTWGPSWQTKFITYLRHREAIDRARFWQFKNGAMTINEYRRSLGLEPYSSKDDPFGYCDIAEVPLNRSQT